METAEDLNALKEEVEALNKKPDEITDEEQAHVAGGRRHFITGYPPGDPCPNCGAILEDNHRWHHDGISYESICPNCKEIWPFQIN